MAVLRHFQILSFLLASLTVFTSDAYLRKYVPLIIGINEHYGPSSICLVMPYSSELGDDRTLTFALTREFSRKGISSLIINSEETLRRVKKYNERVRPIVVVVVTAIKDMDKFVLIKNKYDISHAIWLVIFEDEFGASICDVCKRPTKNIFGLRFDTEMLVVCCKNKLLQEWWSDHRNRTEIASIGEWTVSDGLTSITNQSLYARRSNVAGVGFRVGFVTGSSYYSEENGGQPAGLSNDILMDLARVVDFKITKILKSQLFGSWDANEQSWTGVIELIDKDLVELGVGEFSMLVERLEAVDFTLSMMVSSRGVYFRAVDNAAVQWAAHFKVFALEIWIAIILLVITLPLLLALINMRTTDDSFINIISEHYLNVWGIFCQQGLAAFPKKTSLRIAYCSISIAALVILTAYSAALISFLTVSTSSMPFSSLEDFADAGTYALTVLKHDPEWALFQSSNVSLLIKMKSLLEPFDTIPATMKEAFHKVCSENVAFCTTDKRVERWMRNIPCKIGQIELSGGHSYSFVLKKGSEYTGIINYYFQRFRENGMFNRAHKKYVTIPREPLPIKFKISLLSVSSVLLLFIGGMGLSLIVMLGEKIGALFRRVSRKLPQSKQKTIYSRKMNIRRVLVGKKKHATSHSQVFFKRRTGRSNIPAIEFHPLNYFSSQSNAPNKVLDRLKGPGHDSS